MWMANKPTKRCLSLGKKFKAKMKYHACPFQWLTQNKIKYWDETEQQEILYITD